MAKELIKKEIKVPLIFKGDAGPNGWNFEIGAHPDLVGNPHMMLAKRIEKVDKRGFDRIEMIPAGNMPDDFDSSTDTVEAELVVKLKVVRDEG